MFEQNPRSNMKKTRPARAISVWLTLALAVLVISASAYPASAQPTELFNNTNIFGVINGPGQPTTFTLSASATISEVATYHWNFGFGAAPGSISLRNQSGQVFGPFAARGTAGQGGAPNVNWIAAVNVTVPAGTYTVLDSDPNTWSHNPQSLSRGFTIVRGSLINVQAAELFNNTNIFGVANGPSQPTTFTLNTSAAISEVATYHWNFGFGAAPGSISLRNQSGQVFGPFAARGTAGQNGAPNVNWVAAVNVTVPAGTYTVLDSDPNTWSHNPQSLSRGFAIVRGSLLPQTCPPPPFVFIRGLRYQDYSCYTSLSTATVAPGGFFQILQSPGSPLVYDGPVVVTIQDVNQSGGFGFTAFRLTNVTLSGNTLTAQAPSLSLFQGRTYNVAVFIFGQPWKTASAGQITIP